MVQITWLKETRESQHADDKLSNSDDVGVAATSDRLQGNGRRHLGNASSCFSYFLEEHSVIKNGLLLPFSSAHSSLLWQTERDAPTRMSSSEPGAWSLPGKRDFADKQVKVSR